MENKKREAARNLARYIEDGRLSDPLRMKPSVGKNASHRPSYEPSAQEELSSTIKTMKQIWAKRDTLMFLLSLYHNIIKFFGIKIQNYSILFSVNN